MKWRGYSNIILNKHRFLDLEGPQTAQHIDRFLTLMVNYNVSKIIRLTCDIEDGVFKSKNYWQNNVRHKFDQEYLSFIINKEEPKQIPYSIEYYATNDWQDDKGIV